MCSMTSQVEVESLFSVALALREQVLDGGEVPVGDHDRKVDVIISPDEVIGKEA